MDGGQPPVVDLSLRKRIMPGARRISYGMVLRAGLNLTPEFLVAGTETSGRLVAMKMTGKPELAAIKEDLYCRLRPAH